jgi:FkbM family methyltransferase
MKLTTRIRDASAAALRALPAFPGKCRLGDQLYRLLTDTRNKAECLRELRMWDGSRLLVDVRSRTERWSYWTGEYERELLERMLGILQPGTVALDVGANVGFYSIPLGRALQRLKGQLVAFEPVPENHQRLVEAVRLNHLEDTVKCAAMALGDHNGTVEMAREIEDEASSGNAVVITDGISSAPEGITRAQLRTLDRVAGDLALDRCDLIKVDIEGSELRFLRGAMEFLARCHPIIFGEFSASWMKVYGDSFTMVHALLSPLGYQVFRPRGEGCFEWVREPDDTLQDVLLVPARVNGDLRKALGIASTGLP